MFRKYQFQFQEVAPSSEVLMKYLQIMDQESYSLVEGIVEKTFDELKASSEIVGGFTIAKCQNVSTSEGEIICDGKVLHPGRKISRYMEEAELLALFICTAGAKFTTLSHAYQQNNDLLEAFVVEAIGSATVENAMDKIQILLEKEMLKEGKKTTNRYSPGYCDWHLSDQRYLFEAIGSHPTPITLTESCMMQPNKSVSGIIGIGENVIKREYGCAICNSSKCVYRNILTKKQ